MVSSVLLAVLFLSQVTAGAPETGKHSTGRMQPVLDQNRYECDVTVGLSFRLEP